jgi:hypothetical protein
VSQQHLSRHAVKEALKFFWVSQASGAKPSYGHQETVVAQVLRDWVLVCGAGEEPNQSGTILANELCFSRKISFADSFDNSSTLQ